MRSAIRFGLTLTGLTTAVLLTLSACGPSSKDKTESTAQVTPTPTSTPGTKSYPEPAPETTPVSRTLFVPDRILVLGIDHQIGEADDVTTCLSAALNYTPTFVAQTSLGPLFDNDNLSLEDLPFPRELRPSVVMEVVGLDGDTQPIDAVEQINREFLTTCPLLADLVYVTGFPWTIAPVSIPVPLNPHNMWWQDPKPGINFNAYTGPNRGQNVTIGIFDNAQDLSTSPPANNIPVDPRGGGNWRVSAFRNAQWGSIPTPPGVYGNPLSLPSHGLFVASIVHQVAPQATLEIYEVLNQNAEGDAGMLINAMNTFASSPHPGGAVANLSLGIPFIKGLKAPILNGAIAALIAAGIPVVASAGNDSGPQAYPADHGDVTGVAGNEGDPNATIGCYSNAGDMTAPGGQAKVICSTAPGDNPGNFCHISGFEKLCVVGVRRIPGSPNFENAFWAGTSFSAPYVTGVMALMYEQWLGNAPGRSPNSTVPGVLQQVLFSHPQPVTDPREGFGLPDVPDDIANVP